MYQLCTAILAWGSTHLLYKGIYTAIFHRFASCIILEYDEDDVLR